MIEDPELDRLLSARAAPVAPDGLAARIVAMAEAERRTGTAKRSAGSRAVARRPWYAELAQTLLIPRPAYALAVFLVCGMLIGFTLASPEDMSGSNDWQVTLSSNEAWQQ